MRAIHEYEDRIRRSARTLLPTVVALLLFLLPQPLAAAGIGLSPEVAKYPPGKPVTASFTLEVPRSAKAVQVRGGVQGEKPLLNQVCRGWRAGSRQTLRFDWTPAAPGRYTLFFEIDPANRAGLRRRITRRVVVEGPRVTAPAPLRPSAAMQRAAPRMQAAPAQVTATGTTAGQSQENCTPDLRVSRVEISPPHPRARQEYRIRIWVLQFLPNGVSEPPPAFLAVRRAGHATAIDSRYVQFAQNNSAVTPDYEWTRSDYNPESLEVWVKLDHQNRLNECNEANNESFHPYRVYAHDQPMADLAFQGHVNFDTGNLVNRNVHLWGTVKNRGNAAAGPFWIEFTCDDDREDRTKQSHRVQVNRSVEGGASADFSTYMRWDTPGMKVCIVNLDPEDQVVESSESNNEYIGVTLHVDEPPPVR